MVGFTRGMLVHAISDGAKAFYEHYGFAASPTNPMTLVLSLKGAARQRLQRGKKPRPLSADARHAGRGRASP